LADVVARLHQLAHLPPLDLGERLDVDTSQEPKLADVVLAIRGRFRHLP
jgi:hypothetical protein